MDFDLFSDLPSGVDTWRRAYWAQKNDKVTKWLRNSNNATVEVVLKNEKSPQERLKDFYDAQHEVASNLPEQTKAANLDLFSQQFHRPEDFSDTTTFSGEAADLNPKPDFVSFLKKEDEMSSCPSEAYNQLTKDNFNDPNTVFPNPFGSAGNPIWNPNMKPTSSLPEGSLASDPAKESFRDMQKDNTVDYVGDLYLPKSTQDGKRDAYLPPEFQLSSASADLGCLMAMIPKEQTTQFVNFARQNIDPNTLVDKGIETESHITILYGFDENFDPLKLEKILGGTGPVSFSLGPVSRFKCEGYDVLYFQVNSPDLETLNAKISRECVDQIEETNHRYIPHLTLGYVKIGTNKELDGKILGQKRFSVANLLYSSSNKIKRQIVSLAWDGIHLDDGGMEPGLGKTQEKPLNSFSDALQDFLNKRSEDKKKDHNDLLSRLDKPFGHNKV